MAEEDRDKSRRFGIPSVRGAALRWFYGMLGAGTVYLTVANTLSELSRTEVADWMHVQSIVTDQIVRAAGASLIVSYILADGGDMVISAILRERNRQKDLEERRRARDEGRSEVQTLWEAWNQRRLEAEERGEAFTEPPPSTSSSNGTGEQQASSEQ